MREGNYREDRHGDRADTQYDGTPTAPHGLGKDGQYLWKLINTGTPDDILAKIDSPTMFAMCRWWQKWRELDRRSHRDDFTPQQFRMMVDAWTQCSKMMMEYGMSPVARTRIKKANTKTQTETDPLLKLVGGRAS